MENRIHGLPIGSQLIPKAILTIIELKNSRKGKNHEDKQSMPFFFSGFSCGSDRLQSKCLRGSK